MTTYGKTFFIADLHLEEKRPEITQQFLQFLKRCLFSADALYILGDLFEVWIGDDDDSPLHREVIAALQAVTQQGLPVYFLHGNRDFLIGKKFLKETGCQLLMDETKIMLYNTPVLLMHGDTLCTQDVVYLQARKKGRNRFYQTLFLSLPLFLRKKIADKMRNKSKQHTEVTAGHIMDVTQDAVKQVMHKHNVHFLIHGHTHRPAIHQFSVQHKAYTRIVLGAWHERGHALLWDKMGEKKLAEI